MATFEENIQRIRSQAIYGSSVRAAIAEALQQADDLVQPSIASYEQYMASQLASYTSTVGGYLTQCTQGVASALNNYKGLVTTAFDSYIAQVSDALRDYKGDVTTVLNGYKTSVDTAQTQFEADVQSALSAYESAVGQAVQDVSDREHAIEVTIDEHTFYISTERIGSTDDYVMTIVEGADSL